MMVACRFRADGRTVVAAVRFISEDLLSAKHPLFVSCTSWMSFLLFWSVFLVVFMPPLLPSK